nr:MAG TPA_asm: hypothetical protein [Caudoviricetes sp.]
MKMTSLKQLAKSIKTRALTMVRLVLLLVSLKRQALMFCRQISINQTSSLSQTQNVMQLFMV